MNEEKDDDIQMKGKCEWEREKGKKQEKSEKENL